VSVAIILISAAISAYYYYYSGQGCTITGQAGGLQLRILSDSTLQPILGATVRATNSPAQCNYALATTQTSTTFTTDGKSWFTLPTDNNAGYSFVISYSNQTYRFSASLAPLSITCATLYVPSGKTNVTTYEYQTSC
jgi:hypothetical protein